MLRSHSLVGVPCAHFLDSSRGRMSRADPVRQRGAHESAASSSGSKQGYQPGCCGGGCCSLNGNVTRCWTFDPCTNHKVSVLEKPFPVASTDAAMVAMNPTAVSVAVAGSPAPRPLGTRANAWTADVDLSSMPAFGFRWFPTTCTDDTPGRHDVH